MAKSALIERIKQKVFIIDGAMGTELFARGIEPGKCNEYFNIESPEIIQSVHEAYFKAGCDAVLTNTFGANKIALSRHGMADKLAEINKAGVKIARKAAGENKYVLGDIGPSGDFLEPLGTLTAETLMQVFSEQAKVFSDSGVDGIIIETMTALDEILIAIESVKSVCKLPVFTSMSFDKAGDDFRTMMGIDVESAISKMVSAGVDAVGFNCGRMSLDEYIELAKRCVSIAKKSNPNISILAEPNAGMPELIDGKAVYKISPEEFARACEKIKSAGVNILGGCCGTTPRHISAVTQAVKD